MSHLLRIALTETKNAFSPMPNRLADLPELAGRMEEIRAANVAHHVDLARRAAGAGARAIGFGELFTAPYFAGVRDPMWFGLAEDAETGPTVSTLRPLAAELDLVIVAPIYELTRDHRRFNTAVVIDADGEIAGKYRKTHIPQGENESGAFYERFYYDPADELDRGACFEAFHTRVGRLGVSTCYDRHFDGVIRSLAENGAELIFSPAVTFGKSSRHFWRLEFQVDAMRHRVFIAGSNRAGPERPFDLPYFGDSHVAGPHGLLESDRSIEGLVLTDIDLDDVNRPSPSGWDLHRDRRPNIYV